MWPAAAHTSGRLHDPGIRSAWLASGRWVTRPSTRGAVWTRIFLHRGFPSTREPGRSVDPRVSMRGCKPVRCGGSLSVRQTQVRSWFPWSVRVTMTRFFRTISFKGTCELRACPSAVEFPERADRTVALRPMYEGTPDPWARLPPAARAPQEARTAPLHVEPSPALEPSRERLAWSPSPGLEPSREALRCCASASGLAANKHTSLVLLREVANASFPFPRKLNRFDGAGRADGIRLLLVIAASN